MSEATLLGVSSQPAAADPLVVRVPGDTSLPGASVTLSPEVAARFDPNAAANGQAEHDEQILASLPGAPSGYLPPEPEPGDPPMAVEAIREYQTIAFDVGAPPEVARNVWKWTHRHHAQHPDGIDPGALAINARATLATLERMFGEAGVQAMKRDADRYIARVARGNPDVAQLVRNASACNPLMLKEIADVGRLLPALARRRNR